MPTAFAATVRKIEDLPSDGGRVVDTMAGALLPIFVRLEELVGAFAELRTRVAAIEGRLMVLEERENGHREPDPPRPHVAKAATRPPVSGNGELRRGPGRPKGSLNKPKPNGADAPGSV